MVASYTDVGCLRSRSGFTPGLQEKPSGMNPDLPSDPPPLFASPGNWPMAKDKAE